MLFLGGFLDNSSVYAAYSSNQITSGDMKSIMDSIGFSTTDTKLLNFTGSFNTWSAANNINLLNCIFFNYNSKLYVTLGNGSVGNDYPQIAVFYLSGSINLREFTGWIYSGDSITGANYQALTNVYQIAENITAKVTNASVPSWSGQSPPLSDLDDPYIGVSNAVVIFPTYAVASWQTHSLYAWRFYNQYVTLSTWVTPTPIPTPTETVTPTSTPSGNTDLTETNNKIDNVNQSVNQVGENIVNQISGDTNKIIEQISGDNQKIVEALTEEPNSGEWVVPIGVNASGEIDTDDIYDMLGIVQIAEPMQSLWGTLIDSMNTMLTCDNPPDLRINFLGSSFDIPVLNINYPQQLAEFLELIQVFVTVLVSAKFWRRIYIVLSSGGALEAAHLFDNFDWSNYF